MTMYERAYGPLYRGYVIDKQSGMPNEHETRHYSTHSEAYAATIRALERKFGRENARRAEEAFWSDSWPLWEALRYEVRVERVR